MGTDTRSSSCRPPKGTTYLTIGQDLFSIYEYMTSQYNFSLHQGRTNTMSSFTPAAAMVYTDLDKLSGLQMPIDYGSGVEYADGILDMATPKNNKIGLQIGLWLSGSHGTSQIVNGNMDSQILELANYLKDCSASVIFLRIGYGERNDTVLSYHTLICDIHKTWSKPDLLIY